MCWLLFGDGDLRDTWDFRFPVETWSEETLWMLRNLNLKKGLLSSKLANGTVAPRSRNLHFSPGTGHHHLGTGNTCLYATWHTSGDECACVLATAGLTSAPPVTLKFKPPWVDGEASSCLGGCFGVQSVMQFPESWKLGLSWLVCCVLILMLHLKSRVWTRSGKQKQES